MEVSKAQVEGVAKRDSNLAEILAHAPPKVEAIPEIPAAARPKEKPETETNP